MAESETESGVESRKSRLHAAIVKRYSVRLHMCMILLACVAAGVLLSKGLLFFGVTSMTVRYFLAILAGYMVFLFGVRIWLHCTGFDRGVVRQKSSFTSSQGGGGDFNLGSLDFSTDNSGVSDFVSGQGGNFGGGGASGSFSDSLPGIGSSGGSGGGGGIDLDIDGDGLVALLLIALVLLAIIGAGGYLVYQAPHILSDSAFQMVLAGRLAKHARRMNEPDWMGSLFKETWISLALILLITMIFTLYVGHMYPAAHTLSEVIHFALFGVNG